MVDALIKIHLNKYEANGVELIMGGGSFVGPRTIEVALNEGGHRTLRGKKVIINTGSRARLDDLPGLSESRPLTHVEALVLDQVPEHLLVLGGGYVGLELAQAMRRFGSQVTIVERNDRLTHREDPDVSEGLHKLFHDEGIAIRTNATITQVEGLSGQLVRLLGTNSDGSEFVLEGSHLLVASGRTPNTNDIGLEKAAVELTDRGFVKVNVRLETTAEGVWATGDCAGSPHFTHISYDDFRIVRDNLAGGQRVTTGRQVPYCMFTDPQLARVGLNETEAQQQGIDYRLTKLPMTAALRTLTISEPRGFMKVLFETDSDRILGFTAFGAEAGELLPVVQLAMSTGLPYTALRDLVIAHPTMSEGLTALFAEVPVRADSMHEVV